MKDLKNNRKTEASWIYVFHHWSIYVPKYIIKQFFVIYGLLQFFC